MTAQQPEIAGYVYDGNVFCNGSCVLYAMDEVDDDKLSVLDQAVADGRTPPLSEVYDTGQVETVLELLAAAWGVERADLDASHDFPRPVMSDSTMAQPTMCSACGIYLDWFSPGEMGMSRCPCGGWRPDDENEPPGCPACRGRSTATGYMTADQGASTPPTRWNTGWASDGGVSVGG